jgi:flagellar export protein FliJ
MFKLQIVYDLALKRAEGYGRVVKQAHGHWLRARAQMVRLQAERSRYVEELAERRRTGNPGFYAAADEVWQMFGLRMQRARQELDTAHAQWQQAMRRWEEEEKRVQALTVLRHRYDDELARRDAVRERKLHDEISIRSFIATRADGAVDPGLPWEEHLA